MPSSSEPRRGNDLMRRRFMAQLDDWLTPEALHAIYTRRPADDQDDPAFAELLCVCPDAADLQLLVEEAAFFWDLQQRDRDRAAQAAREQQHLAAFIADSHRHGRPGRRRKPSAPPRPTLPGLA